MFFRHFVLLMLVLSLLLLSTVAATEKPENGGKLKKDSGKDMKKRCRDAHECRLYSKSDICYNPSMTHLWRKCPKKCGRC
ncbi:hypothetical protein NECAME_18307 [Necator americanus]|uniref:ShTK domain protein n=1 Tax=Necator americanus TaxID=51031 RepID=W2SUQ4_NECAM|nr:hypothetical protein NECAME_18311 [Necator americanus]XP_013295701.1 hypothetical protein NECAME_18307 [Necator americanus]ETN73470.1 hypothetical protein NECAME_18311 [Necator americanus]ETN73474.1 hypothetical protein NECAME_18307 [Necator americanus]